MSGSMATGSGVVAVITGIMVIGPGPEQGVPGRVVTGTIPPGDITGTAGTGDKFEINSHPEDMAGLAKVNGNSA